MTLGNSPPYQKRTRSPNFFYLAVQMINYLVRHASGVTRLSEASIKAFFDLADSYQLSSFSRLQIVNRCPQTLVELWLLLDNPETNFDEPTALELLNQIKNVLYLTEPNPDFAVTLQRVTASRRSGRVPSSPRNSAPPSPMHATSSSADTPNRS